MAGTTAERLIPAHSREATGGLQRSTAQTRHIVRRDVAVWTHPSTQW